MIRGDNLEYSIKEKYTWIGEVQIIKRDKITNKIKKIIKIKNRIMNDGLNELTKALSGGPDIELKYLAVGDSSAAIADTQTELDNEIFRVPVLTKIRTGTGVLQSTSILLASEPDYAPYSGVMTLREIGFFCGSAALNWDGGAGKDTGLMMSRILISPSEGKLATEEFQFVRTDTFARG